VNPTPSAITARRVVSLTVSRTGRGDQEVESGQVIAPVLRRGAIAPAPHFKYDRDDFSANLIRVAKDNRVTRWLA
jgi:hypothetical protein